MEDMMPGGNFNNPLPSANLKPQGPLNLPSTSTNIRIYAWVMQHKAGGGCASCVGDSTISSPPPSSWTISSTTPHGSFAPGAAVGTALVTYELAGQYKIFWWSEDIELTQYERVLRNPFPAASRA